MSISSINNYGGTSSTSNSTSGTSSNSTLNMDDFFKLMVAQLSNQDMYNTVDDTEFMAQMAQFSMVQALADLSELSMTSYGVSLIGKEVTVAKVDSNGQLNSTTGIVDSVNFYNGSTEIIVDNKTYPLSGVMKVAEPKIIIPNSTVNNTSTQTNNNSDSNGETGGDGDV